MEGLDTRREIGSFKADCTADYADNIKSLGTVTPKYFLPKSALYQAFDDTDTIRKYRFDLLDVIIAEDYECNRLCVYTLGNKAIGCVPDRQAATVRGWLNGDRVNLYKAHILGGPGKRMIETPDGQLDYEMFSEDFSVIVHAIPVLETSETEARPLPKKGKRAFYTVLFVLLALLFVGVVCTTFAMPGTIPPAAFFASIIAIGIAEHAIAGPMCDGQA